MTLSVMSLFFEAVVAVLLIAVIVYAIKLNGRILALRSQESELKEMIAQFHDAAMQAGESADHLKIVGTESERKLRSTIERAQAMRDDLTFMIERGGKMSNRVDRAIERSRDMSPAKPVNTPAVSMAEEIDDREIERKAEQAFEVLVDRFADQAEPNLLAAAAKKSPKTGAEAISLDDRSSHIDREHWFNDDPKPSNSPIGSNPSIAPRVSAWTPGAGSTAVEAPAEETPKISRSEVERDMLKTLRISGVRS